MYNCTMERTNCDFAFWGLNIQELAYLDHFHEKKNEVSSFMPIRKW